MKFLPSFPHFFSKYACKDTVPVLRELSSTWADMAERSAKRSPSSVDQDHPGMSHSFHQGLRGTQPSRGMVGSQRVGILVSGEFLGLGLVGTEC